MQKLTKQDIDSADTQNVNLAGGLSLLVECKFDDGMGAPWEENDGHGPVTGWERREKRPGEWILHTDRNSKMFYDFAGAMKLAVKDRWGISDEDKIKLAKKLFKPVAELTRGEVCVEAVTQDFDFLRRWCAGDWQWVYVLVTLRDADGNELGRESCCGIESEGDRWKEMACELANPMLEAHEMEQAEAQHWAERDVETVKGGAS